MRRRPLQVNGQPVTAVDRVTALLAAVGGHQHEDHLVAALTERLTDRNAAVAAIRIAWHQGAVVIGHDDRGGFVYSLPQIWEVTA